MTLPKIRNGSLIVLVVVLGGYFLVRANRQTSLGVDFAVFGFVTFLGVLVGVLNELIARRSAVTPEGKKRKLEEVSEAIVELFVRRRKPR